MKNLILLMVFVLGAIGVACQDQSIPSKEDKFREIALNDLYAKHQENFYERAFVVATNAYDLKAVDSLFNKYPEKMEIVDFDKSLFKDIRGGWVYYEIALESHNLIKMLNEKFHFDKFSLDEVMKIDAIFDKLHNGRHQEVLKQRVAEYFTNKNKE